MGLDGMDFSQIFVQLLARVRSIEYFMAFYVQSRIILVLGEREFVIQNYNAIGTLGQVITGFLVAKLLLASHGRHFLAVLMYSFLAHDSNVFVFNCSVEQKTFRIEASVWYSCSIDMNLYVARFIITSSQNVFQLILNSLRSLIYSLFVLFSGIQTFHLFVVCR